MNNVLTSAFFNKSTRLFQIYPLSGVELEGVVIQSIKAFKEESGLLQLGLSSKLQ